VIIEGVFCFLLATFSFLSIMRTLQRNLNLLTYLEKDSLLMNKFGIIDFVKGNVRGKIYFFIVCCLHIL
jgi:hypothetical protein